MKNQIQLLLDFVPLPLPAHQRKKCIKILLLLLLPAFSFAQTFFGFSANPTDNVNRVGPSLTITPPVSMQAGDLVVVYAHHRATGATLTMSTNTGQIWTTATSVNNVNTQSFFIFYCRFNGTWSNNPVISGGNGTTQMSAAMYVFRPSNSAKGWAVHMGPTNTSSGTNPNTINGVTTTAARTVNMAFWASAGNTSWGTFTGTNWTKGTLPAQIRNVNTNSQSLSAAYQIRTTTGATNNVTQTQSATTTANKTFISWAEVDRPSNDDFTNAATISSAVSCVNGSSSLNGSLQYATAEGAGVTPSCGASTAQDVWYKFVARTKHPTITVSGIGSSLSPNFRMQILTGSYSSFTETACVTGSTATTTYTPALTAALTIGTTYYIRIHKSNTTPPTTGNWGFNICITDPLTRGGRMNEVFERTVLSGSGALNYPWEVAYGKDNKLWVTESKGYKVYKIDPNTGLKVTVLDISQGSTTSPDNSLLPNFSNGSGAQGGLAGLALHPNFLDGTANEKNFVYISYIHSRQSSQFFTNRLVRFTYDKTSQRLLSPMIICDTLPGSNDHNSQRVFIAPLVKNGPQYLFYASGDMGAGQGSNITRTMRSHIPASYEGKILRFNLDIVDDTDPVLSDKWIPNDNPYNAIVGKQNAVWNIGIRNNQGFAYDSTTNKIYGASHGAYSDDEINVLQGFTHYGHPYIIGYADGNYDGNTSLGTASNNLNVSAGAPYKNPSTGYGNSTCPPIGSEVTRKGEINLKGHGLYKDPVYSGYPGPSGYGTGSVRDIWQNTTGANGGWPSEGWSGLDIYMDKMIPGWYRSLIASGLKWGRLIRVKLDATGDTTLPSKSAYLNSSDSITYFQSGNRYRDIAFGPNGKDIYIVMDNNSATSGPGTNNPMTPDCPGCLIKYSFLGYADNGGKSSIPTNVEVTTGVPNTCNQGTPVTIDASNNYLWVPITGPDGNILAEINAMGQNLGTVTSTFYVHSGTVRSKKGYYYLNRNITITPSNNTFSTPVKIRLYISKQEFVALDNHPASGITAGIGQLKMMKNDDPCGPGIISSTTAVAVTNTGLDLEHGTNGYVLQGEVTSFSTFYFGASNMSTLPLELITFKGSLQNNATLLQWETANEKNTSYFGVERSTDGRNFDNIGSVTANNNGAENKYNFVDNDVTQLPATVIYYRLKMVDENGQFTYSSVVTISLSDISSKIVLSPNPAKHETKVTITTASNGKAKWKLTDNTGRVVMQDVIQLNRGSNNLVINLNSLSSGMYYLNVSGGGIEQNVKLQKL